MEINSRTKLTCLLGHPVKQSFSPQIHNYLFEKYNQNNIYTCFDTKAEELKNASQGIKSLGIEGCNVTIPHKINIIKYLDIVDENTKLIGAVNTIKNDNGNLIGYNTDGIGFVKSIIDKGYNLKDKRVMIIGAGGACRSISVELANSGVKSVEIRNRSLEKAKELLDLIEANFNIETMYSNKEIKEKCLENIDILINTTPIGMNSLECPIDKKIILKKRILVCDIVYKPHKTEFIKWAIDNDLSVIYGIDMLINQAIKAFEIWTNIKTTQDDIKEIKDIYFEHIEKK